ncbi:helix-turn-helix domain-containing protein, partial [Vandammella animalimorsus]
MEQQWNRMQGVKMVRSGWRVGDVAKFFGVSDRAVFGWVATFGQLGQNGL